MHPIEVGDIVSTMTQAEEIITEAVLHDTIEDCEGVSREILAREFSERVAGIVAQESEDKTKTWMERMCSRGKFNCLINHNGTSLLSHMVFGADDTA